MAIDASTRTRIGDPDIKQQNGVPVPVWTHEVKVAVKDAHQENCDYDTAIAAAGHGRYNNLLLLTAFCPLLSCLLSTSAISFILPSAECDLGLTNFHKGILNAVTYSGMIATGFFWGFLSDTLGRQKLLVITFGLDAFFNLIAGLAQNYTVLLIAKLADGLICAAPYAILMTYLAECNPDKYRGSIVQWSGLMTGLGTVLLPLLAWAILPLHIDLVVPVVFLELNAWRVFLLLSTIPSAVAATSFYFRWESPKFLLSRGRADEALAILRRIYAINTGLTPGSFPVKSLRVDKQPAAVVSSNVSQKNSLRALLAGLKQVRPLFHPPYLGRAALVFLFQFGALLGYNTIRLWMPQLFTSILHAEAEGSNATNVCHLLGPSLSSNASVDRMDALTDECLVQPHDAFVYINSIIIGVVTTCGFLGSGYLTRCLGDISLILVATAGAVVSCVGMYWGVSSVLMLAFSSVFITCTSISSTASISVTLQIFPTETRTMAVALVMAFGQMGGMMGNVVFPLILDSSCDMLFFLLAAILLGTSALVLLLPKEAGRKK